MAVVVEAVIIGMVVVLAGTIPRNLLFAANFRFAPEVPWAIPVIGLYLWAGWRYLSRDPERRRNLRANRVSGAGWAAALLAGGLGLVALVLGLRLANRLVVLPDQALPDLAGVPSTTVVSLLLAGAPVAGLVEESAFRGYMQTPIERRHGMMVAILITGTMFALVHLDFTLVLWPYYVAVAAIYGTVTHHTDSILPAMALHTAGNIYSSLDLWWGGRSEWQAAGSPAPLVWTTGPDFAFWRLAAALVVAIGASIVAYRYLARVSRATARVEPEPRSA